MKIKNASTKSVQEFREAVASSLGAGAAVLLNLIDILAAGSRPNSPVDLALTELFAYDWSSLYQALRRAEAELAETIDKDEWLLMSDRINSGIFDLPQMWPEGHHLS